MTASDIALTNGVSVDSILDENDLTSDSDTALATQQSIKAYVDNNPYGGWLTTGLTGVTVTRASIDDPTVVLTFAADVTDYIWKGSRIKLTEGGTTHYMIVSADPAYSDPNTTVTCLMEIDTATPTQAADPVDAGTITDVAYAPPKTYPKGFPINVFSWSLINAKNDSTTIGSPTSSAWYNDPNFNLIIPIGDFDLFHTWDVFARPASAQNINFTSTVGTVNNNSGYREMTHSHRWTTQGGGSGNDSSFTFTTNHYVSMAVKTTLYTNLRVIGSPSDMRMLSGVHRATSTLL
jgi:hypothetical protein